MRARGLTTLLALTMSATGAFGADLLQAPVATYSEAGAQPMWDGFFFGGDVAAAFPVGGHGASYTYPYWGDVTMSLPSAFNLKSNFDAGAGVLGGFQRRYGSLVVGAVADYDFFSGAEQSATATGTLNGTTEGWSNVALAYKYRQALNSLGTIRNRIGFAAGDDWMVYATAGLAFGQVTSTASMQASTGDAWLGSRKQLAVGPVIGAGFEYAMGPGWALGVEGLGYRLSTLGAVAASSAYVDGYAPAMQAGSKADVTGFQLRLNAVYEFDGDAGSARNSETVYDPNTNIPITLGIRDGFSSGRTRMSLYDSTGSMLISRLTYTGASSLTLEPYLYFEIPGWNMFVSAYGGIGGATGGHLQDEDFPPTVSPYSSTNSSLSAGNLKYATIDVGYYAYSAHGIKLGGLVGFTHQSDAYNAYGCVQTASYPACIAGEVASNTLVISDDFTWNAARLGLAGKLELPGGISFSATAAWLPFIAVSESDSHWLRIPTSFSGPIPGSGSGGYSAYQLEAAATVPLSKNIDIGGGLRYQTLASRGKQNFEDVADGEPQVAKWSTQSWQAYLQTGYHF